jgi:hypothetical protein
MTFKLVNKFVKSSNIKSNICARIICIIFIVLIIFIIPNMLNYSAKCTDRLILIFNNTLFKFMIYLLIGYVAQSNIQLALFMTIAVIMLHITITKHELNQSILDTLIKNQINIKELEINKKKFIELVPSISDIFVWDDKNEELEEFFCLDDIWKLSYEEQAWKKVMKY